MGTSKKKNIREASLSLLGRIDTLLESYGAGIPAQHPIAYHGSDRDGIEKLRRGNPQYAGGIGGGVYVAYYKSVAEYYGKHLYKVKLDIRKSDIFVISNDGVEWPRYLRGYSLLMGEMLQSFIFEVGGTKYLVSKEHWEDDAREGYKLDYLLYQAKYKLDVPFEVFEILDIADEEQDVAFQRPPDLERAIPKLAEGMQGITLQKWIEEGGDPDVDLSDPNGEFIEFEIEFIESIIDKLQAVYDEAERKFEQQFDYIIDLEDVSRVVEKAGYDAVWFVGMRGGNPPVNTELLVFDADDVEIIEQLN